MPLVQVFQVCLAFEKAFDNQPQSESTEGSNRSDVSSSKIEIRMEMISSFGSARKLFVASWYFFKKEEVMALFPAHLNRFGFPGQTIISNLVDFLQ